MCFLANQSFWDVTVLWSFFKQKTWENPSENTAGMDMAIFEAKNLGRILKSVVQPPRTNEWRAPKWGALEKVIPAFTFLNIF